MVDNKGITAEKDEFSEWFTQIMLKADLADYTEVSGCIVFKPTAYEIWEKIKQETDKEFKKLGIKNCYFPLFIPEKFLSKEKEHVKGFSPEVAWVTHAGDTKLNERLAVRPTSEAIMYPSYSKWIRSHSRKMGVQAPCPIFKNQRIFMERRAHSLCNQGTGRKRKR